MPQTQVLVVEDEGIVAADIQERLVSLGYEVPATVSSGEEALQKIPVLTPDLVLMDIVLQGEIDGVEAAAKIREQFDIPVVYLTAHADESTLQRAKITEPFAYIIKPFEEPELHTALEMALHKHKMERERAKLLTAEHDLHAKTVEASVKTLARILSIADPQSAEFGQKMRDYVKVCTEALHISPAWDVETAAVLARVGYVTIPAIVIQKVRAGMPMTPTEKEMLSRIPEAGRNLLGTFPRLETVAKIIYYSAKHFDGTGFPADSTAGVNIPYGSRVLKIVSDLIELEDSGTSKGKALDQMKLCSGHYDPTLLTEITKALASGGPRKGRPIKLKDLCVGQVLTAPIETPDGTLILNEGNSISPWMLKKLSNFTQLSGIKEPIYVEG